MKIKSIAKAIYILAIMAIIWLVFVNTFISSVWHNKYKAMNTYIGSMEDIISLLDASIIEGNHLGDKVAFSINEDIRVEALAKFKSNLTTSLSLIERGEANLTELNKMRNSLSFRGIENYEIVMDEFDERIEGIGGGFTNTKNQIESIVWDDYQQNVTVTQTIDMQDIQVIEDIIEASMILFSDKWFLIINYFNVFLIIVLFLAGVLIHKLVYNDLRYISESLKHIDERQYDMGNLPRLNCVFEEEKEFKILIHQIFNKQKLSMDIKNILIKTYEMDMYLEQLFVELTELLQIDRMGVAFFDYEQEKVIAEYSVANYNKMYLNPGHESDFSSTSLKAMIENKSGYIANDLAEDYKRKPTSENLRLVLQEGIKSNMIIPLVADEEVLGVIILSSKKVNHFSSGHIRIANDIIHEISGFIIRAYLTKVIFTKMTLAFSRLVDLKDNETGDHLERMTAYSLTIAQCLRARNIPGYIMDKKKEIDISRYAAVHDIGKVAVPESILNKPGKLDAAEWEIMKSHVNLGANIFVDIRKGLHIFDKTFFQVAEEIVLGHHEKWDGTGYPNGLKGQEIPLVARIVALGDVFDALVSKRAYKEAFSFERAIEIIEESKGKHFDPVIVEIFMENIRAIKEVYDKSAVEEPVTIS